MLDDATVAVGRWSMAMAVQGCEAARQGDGFDESMYTQYLKDRAKHLDDLDATYKTWQSSESPQTLFQLAEVYIDGLHPSYPRNAETALKYLQLAADQGHGEASATIALFYLAGIVVPQSAATACSILQTRVESGCTPSMFWLSIIHLCGSWKALEEAELCRLLDPHTLATTPFNPDNIQFAPSNEESLALLHRSAEQGGYGRAQDFLSWCYFSGKFVPKQSPAQAVHWATKFSQTPDQMRFKNNGGTSLHLRDALAYIDSVDNLDDNELKQLLQPACDEGSAHAWYLRGLVHQNQQEGSDDSLAKFCFLSSCSWVTSRPI
jgi:hypothetical protein